MSHHHLDFFCSPSGAICTSALAGASSSPSRTSLLCPGMSTTSSSMTMATTSSRSTKHWEKRTVISGDSLKRKMDKEQPMSETERFKRNHNDRLYRQALYPTMPVVKDNLVLSTNIEDTLLDVHKETSESLAIRGIQVELLIVVLPETDNDAKDDGLCQNLGILMHCCLPSSVSRPSQQYLESVAHDIQKKVRGHGIQVAGPFLQNGIPFVSESEVPTIIFGATTVRSSRGRDQPLCATALALYVTEFANVVGDINGLARSQKAQWFGLCSTCVLKERKCCVFSEKENAVIDGGMIRELLIAFRLNTNCWAKRIIFYRAGISEDQILHHEMDVIKKPCTSLEEGYEPAVTFFSVLGIETKTSVRQDVKQESCNHTRLEFYLIGRAHNIHGKHTEALYSVLHDDNNFTAEEIQCISSELCRISFWPTSVGKCSTVQDPYPVCTVAPVFHADIECFDRKETFDGQGKGRIRHVEVLQCNEGQTCNLSLVSSCSGCL